jgi:flagellar biosynthetic protein FliR
VNDVQLLVFARCAGFTFRAPGFSHPDVPPVARAAFAYVLSLALAAPLNSAHGAAPGHLAFAIASELVLGAAIGTAASLLYDGAYAGGRALDDYVGIRGSVPSANIPAGAGFGRLWSLAFAAGFFTLGGVNIALAGFASTFSALPPGALIDSTSLATFAITLPATLLRAALFVAGPAIGLVLVMQIALAAVARIVPRFSTFTLSFGIVIACALLATLAGIPATLPAAAAPWFDLSMLRPR